MKENSFRFKINNEDWELKELSQEEIKEHLKERSKFGYRDTTEDCGRYYGITCIDEQTIFLDKDLPYQRKRKTLIHELIHCYIATCITHEEKNYDEEMVADIVSNSFYIVSDVVNNYFPSMINIKTEHFNIEDMEKVLQECKN